MDEKDSRQGPQRIDLTRFRAVLQKKASAQERFKVDKYTEDVPAMLRECYIVEVMRRRMQFIDEDPGRSLAICQLSGFEEVGSTGTF